MMFELVEEDRMAEPRASIAHWDLSPEALILAGADAQTLLARLKPYLEGRRAAVIQGLIQHHRAETLTEGLMRSGIAALSELAAIESELSRTVRRGEKEATHGPT